MIKLKVRKENLKDVEHIDREPSSEIFITKKEDIISYVKARKQKYIHCIIPSGGIMLWADWSTESLVEHLDNADRMSILIGNAKSNNRGHSLAVITDGTLYIFDIDIEKKRLIF